MTRGPDVPAPAMDPRQLMLKTHAHTVAADLISSVRFYHGDAIADELKLRCAYTAMFKSFPREGVDQRAGLIFNTPTFNRMGLKVFVMLWPVADSDGAVLMGFKDDERYPHNPGDMWGAGAALTTVLVDSGEVWHCSGSTALVAAVQREDYFYIDKNANRIDPPPNALFDQWRESAVTLRGRVDGIWGTVKSEFSEIMHQACTTEEFTRDYWQELVEPEWTIRSFIPISEEPPTIDTLQLLGRRHQSGMVCLPGPTYWIIAGTDNQSSKNFLVSIALWNQNHRSYLVMMTPNGMVEVAERGAEPLTESRRVQYTQHGTPIIREPLPVLDLEALREASIEVGETPPESLSHLADLAEEQDFHRTSDGTAPALQS